MSETSLSDPLPVAPSEPVSATVAIPGSKSITNRALLAASVAEGRSRLSGVLDADDTRAMHAVLATLGAELDPIGTEPLGVRGGVALSTPVSVDAHMSGTTARFALPLLALAAVPQRLDGHPQLRARPMGPSLDALRSLGAEVLEEDIPGRLPVSVRGPIRSGRVTLGGGVSSQFLSGLLLVGPLVDGGLVVAVEGELISRPYVDLTVGVMERFGATVDVDGHTWTVAPGGYRGGDFAVEPDASSASYAWAAAVLTGGSVTVEGLGPDALQGDVAVVDVFEAMGARVRRDPDAITVSAGDHLRGVDVDMSDISDTVMTVAVVAACASGPTRIRNVGFIRNKESDRVAATVTELRRAGVEARAEGDDIHIDPRPLRPATFDTYDDHRMAMSLALLGLVADGVAVRDPGCVAKTFPGYFEMLDGLRDGAFEPAR